MSPLRFETSDRPYRRIVLLGFMASGKSTVGRALASALGWKYVELDAEIEREAGFAVHEIFARLGEPAFRSIEARLTPLYTARTELVFDPGGGWVTNPGLLEGLPADTLTVWLRVSADEVLRRVEEGAEQTVRPLLRGPDPRGRVRELLEAREPLYRRAKLAIDTENTNIEEIVRKLATAVHPGTAGQSDETA